VQPLPAGAAVPQARTGKAAPGMAAALSCPSGTASYHDWNESNVLRWEMDLDTTFAWYGNCAPPSLTQLTCYVAYTFATDILNRQCYQYTYPATNPNRRVAVYAGLIVEHFGLGDLTFQTAQRRERYNTGASSCYWTTWDG
jgi:hypothetical protein